MARPIKNEIASFRRRHWNEFESLPADLAAVKARLIALGDEVAARAASAGLIDLSSDGVHRLEVAFD